MSRARRLPHLPRAVHQGDSEAEGVSEAGMPKRGEAENRQSGGRKETSQESRRTRALRRRSRPIRGAASGRSIPCISASLEHRATVGSALLRLPGASKRKRTSTYLHKSAYFGFGEVGWTTAFVHSNGAAVWLYALTNLSIASRNCLGDVKLTPLSACWPRMLNQHST